VYRGLNIYQFLTHRVSDQFCLALYIQLVHYVIFMREDSFNGYFKLLGDLFTLFSLRYELKYLPLPDSEYGAGFDPDIFFFLAIKSSTTYEEIFGLKK